MPPRARPNSKQDPYRSRMITLFVGSEKTEYYVHIDVLNANAPYWSKRLSDIPPDGGGPDWYWIPIDSLLLSEEDPAVVRLFLEFIYSKPPDSSYTVPEKISSKILMNAKLYCFGVKYEVSTLQSYAITQIYNILVENTPGASQLGFQERVQLIERIYKNTTSEADELRKLLVKDFSMGWEIYREKYLKDGVIDKKSELGMFFRAVPEFQLDLLSYLEKSKMAQLPPPSNVVPQI